MTKDNTLKKTEAPEGEHPVKEKVEEKVDIRKDLTEKEAEELVYKEDHPEAPGSQASKGEKEKTEEPGKEKPGEEPKVELPERYKGKSAEELVKLLDEKEKFIQSRSDEMGELREEAKETIKLKEKVAKIEEETMKESQQPSTLPQRPQPPVISDDEYYENPTKALNKVTAYNQKLADYVDQLTSAKTAPFYQSDMERRREKLYKDLEDKYKDYPVKFDQVKVQEFLEKNPEYFKQYRVKAYEQAYHDLSASDFSQTQKEEKEKVREQVKKELIEEAKTHKEAGNIGLSDLETPQAGSAPEYDSDRMEDDPEYRKKVITDMEERKRKGQI
ncbi:hypothetical protein ES695_13145 [Candidatus Atribacteria bacterium 1244-E10-H5-B2]|nr:MAG: hypothetical protein ES695_13145 [Candidatus Atribacteria bacterium 1244-E10-H5-B2]